MKRFSHNTTGRMLLITCSLLASACGNKANYSSVPHAPVFIQINLSTYHTQLLGPNANQCFTSDDINVQESNRDNYIRSTGYGGILIHSVPSSDPNNITGVDYYAYDMTCPNEVDKNIRVYPEGYPDNKYAAYAVCEQCGSRFDLNSFGMAASESNPSKENLKRHEAIRSGNILTVRERISY